MKLKDLEPEPEMLTAQSRAHELAGLLLDAFSWQDTHEGHDYWSDVHKRLERIANSRAEPGEKF